MKKNKYNIAVTGLNAIDSPGPGVGVIRGLREAESFDVRIIGMSYESLEPGIYMHDLVNKTYHIPYPSAGIDNLVNRLEYVNEKEQLDVIIPNFDAELYSFIKLEPTLKRMGIATWLPSVEQFDERHKENLPEFGGKYDLKVPESKPLFSTADLYNLVDDFKYPLMVKGKYYDAGIAYNTDQARTLFDKISAKWGLPIIVQEFIHGTEYNVIGLGDGKGNTIAAVPMRKLYITDKGKAWAGISIAEKKLIELTQKFVGATKWKGGFELELMKSVENEYYILEINPRIPAWVYLSIGVGQNIPEALVNLAMGKDVKPYTEFKVGKMFIRYSYDMIVDIAEFEQISTFGEL